MASATRSSYTADGNLLNAVIDRLRGTATYTPDRDAAEMLLADTGETPLDPDTDYRHITVTVETDAEGAPQAYEMALYEPIPLTRFGWMADDRVFGYTPDDRRSGDIPDGYDVDAVLDTGDDTRHWPDLTDM